MLTREKVLKLLSKTGKDTTTADKKLLRFYQAKPAHLEDLYETNHNIFHYLVRASRTHLIKKLLNDPKIGKKASLLAQTTTVHGNNLLHLALIKETPDPVLIALICDYFPHFIEAKNQFGNNALIIERKKIVFNLEIIKILLKYRPQLALEPGENKKSFLEAVIEHNTASSLDIFYTYLTCPKKKALILGYVNSQGDHILHQALHVIAKYQARELQQNISRKSHASEARLSTLSTLSALFPELILIKSRGKAAMTPLQLAVNKNLLSSVTILLKHAIRYEHILLQLLDLHFSFKKNVFHFLTEKNLGDILEILLQRKDLEALASKKEKFGNTILHIAVSRNNLILAHLICQHLPHLISQENKKGVTPLIIAAKTKNKDMISLLLENEGKLGSPYMSLNISPIEPASVIDSAPLDELAKTYKSLTPRTRKNSSKDKSSNYSDSSTAITSFYASSDDFCHLSSPRSSNALAKSLDIKEEYRLLLRESQSKHSNPKYHDSLQTMNEHLIQFPIHTLLDSLADVCDAQNHAVLFDLMSALKIRFREKQRQTQKQLYKESLSLTDFITSMMEKPSPSCEQTGKQKHRPEALTGLSALIFDMLHTDTLLSHQAILGLQTKAPLKTILGELQNLLPLLHGNSLLNLNQILFQSLIIQYHHLPDTLEQVKNIQRLQLKYKENFSQAVDVISLNQQIELLLVYIGPLLNSTLRENIEVLQQQLVKGPIPLSFTSLVAKALRIKPSDRKQLCKQIANEMKALTIEFYQKLEFTGLDAGAWNKKYGKETAPNIHKMILYCENLKNYFIQLILDDGKDIISGITLLLEIFRELCLLSKENQVDFNNMMLVIRGTLGYMPIDRLMEDKKIVNLSKEQQALFDALQRLGCPTHKYGEMSKFNNSDFSILPFFGQYQRELDYVYQSQLSPIELATQVGKVLAQIDKAKKTALTLTPTFSTDIKQFLESYPIKHDNEIAHFALSLKIKPRASDHINLDETKRTLAAVTNIIDWIDTESLFPTITLNKEYYDTDNFCSVFFEWLRQQYAELPADEQKALLQLIEKLPTMFVEIHQRTYKKSADILHLCRLRDQVKDPMDTSKSAFKIQRSLSFSNQRMFSTTNPKNLDSIEGTKKDTHDNGAKSPRSY